MDVDQPPFEAAHEVGAEDAHEAGEGDDIGRVRIDPPRQLGIERVACRESAMLDDLGGDAALARERQPGGVGTVAQHRGDARVPALARAGAHDRFHVRAAARDEDDDVLHRRAQCIGAARSDIYNEPLLPACRR
jgi:hypothetical protein